MGQLLSKYANWILFIFIGFCVADILIIAFRDRMLPQGAPPIRPQKNYSDQSISRESYQSIIARNIFSADGKIPESLSDKNKSPEDRDQDLPPILSQLPLTLIGTLVHSNPEKSLAAIEVRPKNQVISYTIKKEIEGLATVEKIERMKVFIRNLNTNRLEYIEMKKEGGLSFGGSTAESSVSTANNIQQVRKNEFTVKQSDVQKYLNNMSSILMDARVIPNRNPGDGTINGYRFVDVKPDSLFTQIGFKVGDVIKEVNGEKVDSLEKSMQMFQTFKNATQLNIKIERGGRSEVLKYNVVK